MSVWEFHSYLIKVTYETNLFSLSLSIEMKIKHFKGQNWSIFFNVFQWDLVAYYIAFALKEYDISSCVFVWCHKNLVHYFCDAFFLILKNEWMHFKFTIVTNQNSLIHLFFWSKRSILENQLFFNHEIEQSNSIQTIFLLYLKINFSE